MTVLPIVTDLTALRVKSQPVTVFDDDLRTLAADMVETMRANNGIGLAAVQVGVPMRVIVVRYRELDHLVMVNPSILARSHNKADGMEGCLSIPNAAVIVRRPIEVYARWQGLDGGQRGMRFTPYDLMDYSRVIQHELDHLNGVLITDYALEAAR